MKVRQFLSELWLPRPREEVFAFFSDARNLDAITPPWVRFRMETAAPVEMKAGALIDYKLRVRGFPIRWRTKITEWEPPVRFVDEHLRGPYRLWIHEHEFEPRDGGTLMRDRVRYAVAFDFLVHNLFVRRDVARIFAYRTESLRRRFESSGVDLRANGVNFEA
ncbi:MAG TPA: SRPBCC family protein [Chthoniobacterales bacterium]|nr:SRPBCC family protein [Chthoniobacterales bacterium]